MTEKAYQFNLEDFVPLIPAKRTRQCKKSTNDITITLNKNGHKTQLGSARVAFHNELKNVVNEFDKVAVSIHKEMPVLQFKFVKSDPNVVRQKGLYKLEKKSGTYFAFTMTDDIDKKLRKKFINRDFCSEVISCDPDKCIVHVWLKEQK